MPSELQTEGAGTQNFAARAGKYLTFRLGEEQYGLEIRRVREIIGMMDITPVPQMPAHVKGVINLRGQVIPLVDLRLKFGMPPAKYTDATCIIVVNVGALVGLVVDTVREVLDITAEQIDAPPPLGAAVDTSFLLGMGKVRDGVKILLDADKLLNEEIALAADEA